jgi:hypothetical protein
MGSGLSFLNFNSAGSHPSAFRDSKKIKKLAVLIGAVFRPVRLTGNS